MHIRGTVPWKLCRDTAKLLRDAERIVDRQGLKNLAEHLGQVAAKWEPYIAKGERRELPKDTGVLDAVTETPADIERRCELAASLICEDREDANKDDILNYVRYAFGLTDVAFRPRGTTEGLPVIDAKGQAGRQ